MIEIQKFSCEIFSAVFTVEVGIDKRYKKSWCTLKGEKKAIDSIKEYWQEGAVEWTSSDANSVEISRQDTTCIGFREPLLFLSEANLIPDFLIKYIAPYLTPSSVLAPEKESSSALVIEHEVIKKFICLAHSFDISLKESITGVNNFLEIHAFGKGNLQSLSELFLFIPYQWVDNNTIQIAAKREHGAIIERRYFKKAACLLFEEKWLSEEKYVDLLQEINKLYADEVKIPLGLVLVPCSSRLFQHGVPVHFAKESAIPSQGFK